jgi:hypothetical protein
MAHVLIGAGVGAATSLATGGDPLKGALLGGVTGGVFGGAEGGLFGSATSSGSSGATTAANTIGGHVAGGASTGVASGATSGAVSGATSSPFAFGDNALEVASGSTMPLTATGTASVQPTTFDKLVNKVTPAGGYGEESFLDKVSNTMGFDDMSTKDKVGLGLLSADALSPDQQAQSLMDRPTTINAGKPVDVNRTETGMLNVNVPDSFIDTVKKRQLFSM